MKYEIRKSQFEKEKLHRTTAAKAIAALAKLKPNSKSSYVVKLHVSSSIPQP